MKISDLFGKSKKMNLYNQAPADEMQSKSQQDRIEVEYITNRSEPEVIPVEERLKTAILSKEGLYPHEILILEYANTFMTDHNDFQGFWWYKYGVHDVDFYLKSLYNKGFIQVGDINAAIESQTATELKNQLKSHGLVVGGKKNDLVNRMINEVPLDELEKCYSRRPYQLTTLGKEALKNEGYVLYIHRHPIEDLDIWSLNTMVHTPPYLPYRDKIWGYLNHRGADHVLAGDYGMYRNCRYQMYLFLMEEEKTRTALEMIIEVIFFDLSGLWNGYNPQYLSVFASHYFPYRESSIKIPPGILQAVIKCQNALGITDDELKYEMIRSMSHMSAPLQIFSPEECAEIVLYEMHQNANALTNIYENARKRFEQNYPGIL